MENHGRKIPIPRKLDLQENAASLRLWKVHVTNYYRADPCFSFFVRDDTTWNMAAADWGFADEAETSQLKRKKAEMKADCHMFLETFASYFPDDYLVEKITKNTGKLKDVWRTVDEFYNVILSSDSFLGLAKLTKKPQETYRQFYLRMEGFVSKHLTKAGVKVEEVVAPVTGDTLSITIKNIIVITWMSRIHERLIDCVRVEFASELRGQKELIELMPRIADNIDHILARHDITSAVSQISIAEDGDEACQEHNVYRVGGALGQRGRGRGQDRGVRYPRGGGRDRDRGRGQQGQYGGKTLKCGHCEYLSRTLRLKIDSQHEPTECIRKDVAIRLTQLDQFEEEDYSTAEDAGDVQICTISSSSLNLPPLQTTEDCHQQRPGQYVQLPCHDINVPDDIEQEILSDKFSYEDALSVQRTLLRTEASEAQARSPALKVSLHNHPTIAVIDEGAEVSVLALKFAKLTNTEIVETSHSARAADSSKLRVVGRTKKPVILITEPHGVPIYLKYAVVVDQLNADVLIGEPGKGANNIVTYAADKKIAITFQGKEYKFDYHKTRGPVSHVARVSDSDIIEPGKNFTWRVPDQFQEFKHLFLQPRHSDHHWFEPAVCQVSGGKITLRNHTDSAVSLTKGKPFGEIRFVEEIDINHLLQTRQPVREEAKVQAVFKSYPDQEQYVSKAEVKEFVDHTDSIQLDPGGILTPAERVEIKKLCQEYKDVIRPEPGLYNGHFGHIDNKIDFKSKPPYTQRIYQQKLTEPMTQILAKKMDDLHSWGVLQYPEHVGVRPCFVSPSMIVPKQEKNQWRLVSNFQQLNTYINKPVGSNPTMQQAKDFLAKKEFHIHCDFSNFFYQSGIERQDIQYLGTLHPYKGLMVFCCEPQGVLGAPEHSYERLARVFGTLIGQGKCVQMADGLHIGSDTKEGAVATLKEVLRLARLCSLTLKPSKLEVFPVSTVLFGWRLEDSMWSPTVHTTSALAAAPLPKTVKSCEDFWARSNNSRPACRGMGSCSASWRR